MADYAFGLDADLKKKQAGKYSKEREEEVRAWVEAVTGKPIGDDFQAGLMDGILLCELANIIQPGGVRKINTGKAPFVQRENITNYLAVCRDLGMVEVDLFVTHDLYEGANLGNVVDNLFSLSARARKTEFGGPFIGAKQSDKNVREFTPEQLAAGKNILGKQTSGSYGYQVDIGKGMDKIKRYEKDEDGAASSGPTQQTAGSYGYQVDIGKGMDKIKRYEKDEDGKAAAGPTQQTQGSYGYQTDLGKGMDAIKRYENDEGASASAGPTQITRGSHGFQPEHERHTDAILRGNQDIGPGSSVPSQQTQGSYGYQVDQTDVGVDAIIRDVDALKVDREKAHEKAEKGGD